MCEILQLQSFSLQAGILAILNDMQIIIFLLANATYALTFLDFFRIKAQREYEVNRIERDLQKDKTPSWVKFLRSFSVSYITLYLSIYITINIFWSAQSFNLLLYFQSLLSNWLFTVFLFQIVLFFILKIFIRQAKEIFARQILVKSERTRTEKLFLTIKILFIFDLAVIIGLSIVRYYFISNLFIHIAELLTFYLSLGVMGTFIFYIISRYFLDLNYSKLNEPLFSSKTTSISNICPFPKFRKSFIVLKLEGVLSGHPFRINYKILKYIDNLAFEIKFSPNKREILIWLFVDGVRSKKLIGRLGAIARTFSTLFPSARTSVLDNAEVKDLLALYKKWYILAANRKIGVDFVDPNTSSNKIDELLRALTTLKDLEGSIVLNFKLHDLPKTLLKKKQFHFQYSPGGDTGMNGTYQEQNTFDEGIKKRTDYEQRIMNKGFIEGMFGFDLFVLLNHNEILSDPYEREIAFIEVRSYIHKIYNIELSPLGRIKKFLLNRKRLKFRQFPLKKIFVISGDLMQYLLTFPSIHHIDLPVVKESKFAFPDPCNLDENPVSLGILTEHEAKQNWTFPLAEFTRSMMIPGVPGMGKTNFILNLLSEIKKYQVPYFIFDVKYDYVPLFDESTLWLKPGCNFFLNMFDIKDQKPEAHASFLNGLIKALFPPEDFSPIVANLLLKALLNTCRDETKRSVKGFWKAVDEEVENVPRRNQDEVKAALHVRLTPFFEGAIGEVIKDSPIDIYQLFEQKVILDLNYFESKLGASYQDKHFLAKLILGYLMNKNASRAHVMQGGRLLHLCIIDDASSYFEKDDKGKNPFLTHIIQLCRKMGEGMIISDQTSDNLDENVVGFVNNIVAFRHPDKNQTTRNALGLPLNPNYLAELKKFSAWVRTNQSSEPFKIETLEYAPRKIYTFEEIDQFTNQNLGKLFPKFQQVQNNGFETSYNSECRIVEKNLIMNQAIRFPHKENSEKHRSNQNINELYEIVADKEKIIRLLAENIDIAGFLTVRQIQTIFMTMQDPNLVAFRNSISRVRGFLKVLVQVRPKLFSKKKMSIDGTLITVLIYSKYSHIYDLCNFHQNSETGGNITSIQINREIFLEAINEPIIVKEIR